MGWVSWQFLQRLYSLWTRQRCCLPYGRCRHPLCFQYDGYDLQAFNLPDRGVTLNDDIIDHNKAVIEADQTELLLNEEYRRISEEALDSVGEGSLIAEKNLITGWAKIYFVDATGRTGKTLFFNHIKNKAVAGGYRVKAPAWTGIAATLLKFGPTIHSKFQSASAI